MGKQLKLSRKQKDFVETYLDTGNATEAADRAYKPKNRNTAHAIGAENLQKPTIRAYLEARAVDAMAVVYKLSQEAKNENVRLNASRDILDRAGYFVDKIKGPEAKEPPVVHIRWENAEKHDFKGDTISR